MQSSQIIINRIEKYLASLYIPEIEYIHTPFSTQRNIKHQVISCNHEVEFPNDTLAFNIFIDSDFFKSMIFSEINSESHRIDEQIKNVDYLIKSNAQPAWIIVTTYYACFFIANLFNKLMGKTSINFQEDELKRIFLNDSSPALSNALQDKVREIPKGQNFNYNCIIERSQTANQLKLRFIPGGDRPHEAVWSNFFQNINSLDRDLDEFTLLKNIVNINHGRFPLPNKLRNNWNYSDQKYFSMIGTSTAKKFIHIISNSTALNSWITNECNYLSKNSTDEDNQVCSLAFLFNILKKSYLKMLHPQPIKMTHKEKNLSRSRKNSKKRRNNN